MPSDTCAALPMASSSRTTQQVEFSQQARGPQSFRLPPTSIQTKTTKMMMVQTHVLRMEESDTTRMVRKSESVMSPWMAQNPIELAPCPIATAEP
jgi:hypothetical protein